MAVPQTYRCPCRLGTVWQIVNYNKYQDISAQRQLALDGKTNSGQAGNGPQNGPETDRNRTTREEVKEKKNAGPDGTGASADPVKALFDIGVDILTKAGKPEGQARSLESPLQRQVEKKRYKPEEGDVVVIRGLWEGEYLVEAIERVSDAQGGNERHTGFILYVRFRRLADGGEYDPKGKTHSVYERDPSIYGAKKIRTMRKGWT